MADNRQYSEDEAKRILARAAEIDATDSAGFRAADLREIAEHASIPAAAVDQALAEMSQPAIRAAAHAGLRDALIRIATGAGLGVLAVTADSMSLGPESAAAVFGPSAAYIIYRALWHRWHGRLRDFAQDAVLSMGSFTLAATAMEGAYATTPAGLWALGVSAVGGVIASISFRRVSHPSSEPPQAIASSSS